MIEFFAFVTQLVPHLWDLFTYARGPVRSVEEERRIAAALIRSAMDEDARRDIAGP